MLIQVKHLLTKTRNPSEYDITLERQKGELLTVLGDGYCLIEFEDTITKSVKVDSMKIQKKVKLQWYVHEQDFYIPQRLEQKI